jgi:hypothetical protein
MPLADRHRLTADSGIGEGIETVLSHHLQNRLLERGPLHKMG